MGKLVVLLSLIIILAMMTPSQLSLFASPTTEDDGYTYPDDASENEKEEIDEREQEEWEDAGRPGEHNDNGNDGENDDGDDEEQILTPSLTATTAPVPGPTSAPLNAMDVTTCETAGMSDGKIGVFDAETFRECKLHLLNDYSNTYYSGFVKECIKQVGQTEHTCVQAVKDAV